MLHGINKREISTSTREEAKTTYQKHQKLSILAQNLRQAPGFTITVLH